jgi:hypothetical protein
MRSDVGAKVASDRDEAICAAYGAGRTYQDIADEHGISRQRVQQIVGKLGKVDAATSREKRRTLRDEALQERVQEFVSRHGEAVQMLAAAGETRADVAARVLLLRPDLTPEFVNTAIRACSTIFDPKVQEVAFPQSVIGDAVWYAVAVDRDLEPDPVAALSALDLAASSELAAELGLRGLDETTVARVVTLVANARTLATSDVALSMTKARYDVLRGTILVDLGLASAQGMTPWPPTSQTVMKRLGGGLWSPAMVAVGVAHGSRGRAPGLLRFTEADYAAAIGDFLASAATIGHAPTFATYEAWVVSEGRSGSRRPSGPSVRLFYGGWNKAVRATAPDSGPHTRGPRGGLAAWDTAAFHLHHAQGQLRDLVAELETGSRASNETAAREYVHMKCFPEFETRRRNWMRAVIASDPGLVVRRMALPAGSLAKHAVHHLRRDPADVSVLKDSYFDNLWSPEQGEDRTVRSADGWLVTDAQTELDLIPDDVVAHFEVLRALRNLFSHPDSTTAPDRVRNAIDDLATFDASFAFNRPVTFTIVIDWLLADSGRRIKALGEAVPAAWRAMVLAEAMQLAGEAPDEDASDDSPA